ncbi:hypothetical protein KVP09_09060 [Alcaligenaceae bacterium CGII-47]|nr:hypothetical protein [Alcaligenaceae bacterium CGII-47]
MNRFFLALMMFVTFSVSAAPIDTVTCRMEGEIFENIARARDRGMAPDAAYKNVSGYLRSGYEGINEAFLKGAVNMIYFDPEFAQAGGPLFRRRMTERCIENARQKFQPLQ